MTRKKVLIASGHGIGDVIVSTVGVRELHEQYDIDFYLTPDFPQAVDLVKTPCVSNVFHRSTPYGIKLGWNSVNLHGFNRAEYEVIIRSASCTDFFTNCINVPDSNGVSGGRYVTWASHIEAFIGRNVAVRPEIISPSPQYRADVIMHPGAKWDYFGKRWHRFPTIARRFKSICVVGARQDIAPTYTWGTDRELFDADIPKFINRPISEVVSAIAAAKLFIGCDSGIAHISVGLGIPSILIFGPTKPAYIYPPFDNLHPIWMGLECSPCKSCGFLGSCHFDDGNGRLKCMTQIEPDMVLSKVREIGFGGFLK